MWEGKYIYGVEPKHRMYLNITGDLGKGNVHM